MKGFEVIPEAIDFGVLKEGSTYSYKFALKNTGIDLSYFKIKQPPPSTGIKVIYIPGPVSSSIAYTILTIKYHFIQVAAGLTRLVTVELFAMAVDNNNMGECKQKEIYHELEITTESTILYLPIKANILYTA